MRSLLIQLTGQIDVLLHLHESWPLSHQELSLQDLLLELLQVLAVSGYLDLLSLPFFSLPYHFQKFEVLSVFLKRSFDTLVPFDLTLLRVGRLAES